MTTQATRRDVLAGVAPLALMATGLVPAPAGAGTRLAKARPFPLGAVRLLPSPYRDALEANRAYLHDLDPDRLLHNFREAAGLAPKAPAYGGWEADTIAGHSLGHYLSACALMAAQAGDAECRRRVSVILDDLALCQARAGDGFVGGFTRKRDGRVEPGRRVFEDMARGEIHATPFALNGAWSPLYTIHKLMAGLLDADALCAETRAIAIAEALGAYLHRHLMPLDDAALERVLICEYGGLNESFATLHARTGDPRWRALADRLQDRRTLDPLMAGRDNLAFLHANTQIPKVIGLAVLGRVVDDPRRRAAARHFWHLVTTRQTYANGGVGDREYFQAPGAIASHVSEQTCESCCAYNMLKLTRALYADEPDARLFDYYERVHVNHILAQQNPRDGMFAYMNPLMAGSARAFSTPRDDFWCCVGTGMESHAKHGDSVFWRQGAALVVNLYVPATLDWAERGLRLSLSGAYPFGDDVRLTIDAAAGPRRFPMRLRVPNWCDAPRVTINGADATPRIEGGYVTLTRVWRAGDVVDLTLPRALRIEPTPDDPDLVALFEGPALLAADLGPADPRPPETRPPEPPEPDPLLIDGVWPEGLSPLTRLWDRRTAVYFRRVGPGALEAERARRAAQTQAEALLDQLSIDVLRLGEEADERAHGLIADLSYPVLYRGRRGRDARSGGIIRASLAGAPGPLILRATYWGEERDRRFRILVDDHLIAVESLDGSGPAAFITRDYVLPPALAGAASLALRIEPEPDHTAGPIFGLRLLPAV